MTHSARLSRPPQPYSHWVSQLAQLSTAPAVTFLAYLRLLMIAVTVVTASVWQQWHSQMLPLLIIAVIAAILACLSLTVRPLRRAKQGVLREISIDIIWIVAFLWFSGRAENPFIYYLMVVVALASLLLSLRWAACVTTSCIAAYTIMLYVDVQAHFSHLDSGYRFHLIGMWLNFIVSACIVFICVSALTAALRLQHQKMLAFNEKTLKNEQLIGLATVSASAVHNLATPLSTLRVLVDDFAYDHQSDTTLQHDVELMRQQIVRCEDTIKNLSELARSSDSFHTTNANVFMALLNDHYLLQSPQHRPRFSSRLSDFAEIRCTDLLQFALVNLINNALESTVDTATVHSYELATTMTIDIENTVEKSDTQALKRWGEPTDSRKHDGLGIGSFLANSTIEQHRGSVRLLQIDAHTYVKLTVRIQLPLCHSPANTD